jgi:hypothetical protein
MTKMREMMEQMREKSAMERQERALERERERERETQLSQLVRALAEKIDVHGGNLERPPPVPTRQVAAGHVTTASANRGLGWPVSPRGLEPRAARALEKSPEVIDVGIFRGHDRIDVQFCDDPLFHDAALSPAAAVSLPSSLVTIMPRSIKVSGQRPLLACRRIYVTQ